MLTLADYIIFIAVVRLCSPSAVFTGDDAVHYLAKFGYLEPMAEIPPDTSVYQAYLTGKNKPTLSAAVWKFQEFAGLKSTGTLDAETMNVMNKPRCGNPDTRIRVTRSKRFAISNYSWNKETLTYRVMEYPRHNHIFAWLASRFTKTRVDSELRVAFSFWAQASGLQFVSLNSGNVDIEIRFAEKVHGGANDRSFDGPGTEIAHAFLPDPTDPLRGDIHFDNEEPWVTGQLIGGTYHFRWAAVHEIGHALGLHHSSRNSSYMFFMYPFDYHPSWKLHEDDVQGIRALYPNLNQNISKPSPEPTVTPLWNSSFNFSNNSKPKIWPKANRKTNLAELRRKQYPVPVDKFKLSIFVGRNKPRFSYPNNKPFFQKPVYPQFICKPIRNTDNVRRYSYNRDFNAVKTSKHICIPFQYFV